MCLAVTRRKTAYLCGMIRNLFPWRNIVERGDDGLILLGIERDRIRLFHAFWQYLIALVRWLSHTKNTHKQKRNDQAEIRDLLIMVVIPSTALARTRIFARLEN
ncbi:hypothetical protein [Paracoccus sp. PAR01]|uniref:hypothetical protein n=1 Tax=Paracoccus sp. PAR01 TaxID=2769282 RepID=UPI00177D442E|nr:hypothetical protein [Paracoccus sp. PAR01]MBD9528733.1 hypothetical protein [Paracoccus sp. PAR01]